MTHQLTTLKTQKLTPVYAMDTAGLAKLSRQAIINVVMVLGFLAHGYATSEFEVTEERLGVYLPVEHIDNPKFANISFSTVGNNTLIVLPSGVTMKAKTPDRSILV